jgi:hypothetical protein
MNASSEPRMYEEQVETTGYSISAAAPVQPERRADERFVRLLRVGAIKLDGRRELCLIRNISAGGAMIRAYSSLEVGTSVTVEFKHGNCIAGQVHWNENDFTGIHFDEPIDVLALLATDATGPQPRLPRIELECSAWVRQQARLICARVVNVSQGGLCVRSPMPLELGGDVVATLPGLTPAPGVVKWGKDGTYGIGFNRPLVLKELVEWLKERQGVATQQLAS